MSEDEQIIGEQSWLSNKILNSVVNNCITMLVSNKSTYFVFCRNPYTVGALYTIHTLHYIAQRSSNFN